MNADEALKLLYDECDHYLEPILIVQDEVARLRARVSELEAGETEWAVQVDGEAHVIPRRDEREARATARHCSSPLTVVNRSVGPWAAADKTGDPS